MKFSQNSYIEEISKRLSNVVLKKAAEPFKVGFDLNELNLDGDILDANASWATTIPDRKSVTGYLITIGNNLILWRTTKQGLVTMSAMEAELIALSELVKEIIWFRRCLNEVVFEKIVVNCDNQAGMHFIRNDVENFKTKYIDVKLQFVREHYKNNLFNCSISITKKNLDKYVNERL
uniref:RNase H type-1 domain-containing protein n=1 Tax=Strigamia maritima TaxID=126957 RepID=T1JC33_STRMM